MSGRLKGLTGEELPATLFAMILLFVLIFFTLTSYMEFFGRASFIEQERIANVLVERVAQDNGNVIFDPDSALDIVKGNVKGVIVNLETLQKWEKGSVTGDSVAASSRPIVIREGSRDYPGRVEMYVGV